MSAEENKAITQRAIERFNGGDLAGYLDLYDKSLVIHGYPPELPPNFEGIKQFYDALMPAFPDARVTGEDMVAEGDEVAYRFTFRGTNRGEFMGIPATGEQVTVSGIAICRFADGKCVERWMSADMLGMMQQLGVIPAPEATEA